VPEENELGQEKTEKATPRRREKAREKGSVARSKEVNSAVVLFFGLCVLALYGPYLIKQLIEAITYIFLHFPEIEITETNFHSFAIQQILFMFKLLLPIFFVLLVIGVVTNVAQFGWLYTTQTIFQGLKNFSLNPAKVLKRFFDANSFFALGINIAKLIILLTVAYYTLKKEISFFPMLVNMPLPDSLRYTAVMLFKLALKIIVLLLILGIIDFIWQKYKYEKSIKMSKEEIKDEMKMVEGDPKIKSHIKSTQMKMMVSTMVKKVPEADVVITNPFHIAIAVKYDPLVMNAPTVIAKGARLIAERIKDIARIASVPIVENKPLAQTIYKTINVGEEIPPKLYQAVAEILAYVYKLNKDRARRYAAL